MRKTRIIKHEFIELLPSTLETETLYVSLKHKNMIHLCFCGCGRKVITPLSPTGWALTFNGRELSVFPSIGNWNLPCRSHYWIRRSRVQWAEQWSAERIAAGYARDRTDKDRYYSREEQPHVLRDSGDPEVARPEDRRSLWEKLKGWFW
jgi:hypothetical protein